MNPEAQRIALATAEGWTFIETLALTGIPKGSRGNADARVIPDYLSDLNALHSAAKAECEKRGWTYGVHFAGREYVCVIYDNLGSKAPMRRLMQTANPDQCAALCEWLLRAMNLWTEQPNQ